ADCARGTARVDRSGADRYTGWRVRILRLTAAGVCAGALGAASVSAQAQAALHVGATVVPHCRITVDDQSPTVTASCAASTLRALRVTTNRGDLLRPIAGRRIRAGGDATFVVSRAQTSDPGGRTVVVVTLDF